VKHFDKKPVAAQTDCSLCHFLEVPRIKNLAGYRIEFPSPAEKRAMVAKADKHILADLVANP
jgi:hypothetical protein